MSTNTPFWRPTTNPFLGHEISEKEIYVRFMNTAPIPKNGKQEIWDGKFELKYKTTIQVLHEEALRRVNRYEKVYHAAENGGVFTKVTILSVMETFEGYFYAAEIGNGLDGERTLRALNNRLKDGRDFLLVKYERARKEEEEVGVEGKED